MAEVSMPTVPPDLRPYGRFSGSAARRTRTLPRMARLMSRRPMVVAAMAALASVVPNMASQARAEVIARYPANQWVVEANASGGVFRNCSMTPASGSGAKVILVLGRDGKWGIGAMNLATRQSPGATSSLTYWVDDVLPRGATGSAVDETTVVAPLANSTQLFEEFRLGAMMNVRVGSSTLQYSTNGTSVALTAVSNCVRRHGQGAQAPK
jgi:hypothetical protein